MLGRASSSSPLLITPQHFSILSTCAVKYKMAAGISSVLNRIASLGLGVAVVGGVVNTALYNGKDYSTVE